MHTCCLGDQWLHGGIVAGGVYFHGDASRFNGEGTVHVDASCTTCDSNVERQLHRLVNGAYFDDGRAIERVSDHLGLPMLQADLQAGHIKLYGGEIVQLSEGYPVSSCAAVAPDIYSRLALQIGSKIGHRVGDTMEWSDGTITEIAECDCWKGVCLGCRRLRHYVDRRPNSAWAEARTPSGPEDHCPECKRGGVHGMESRA